jgi:predicted acetyltransferase
MNPLELELTVERVDESANALIANLFNFYLHDMAEWFIFDVGADGTYGYDLQPHWQRGEEFYIARCGGQLAGFALVGSADPWIATRGGYDVVEFFVIRRYRHTGIAEAFAREIWDMHRGPWVVRVFRGNLPAIPFWRKAVSHYTREAHTEEHRIVNDKPWSFFHFDNRAL